MVDIIDAKTRLRPDMGLVREPDLRREFATPLQEWGSHVLLVRVNKNVHHKCWDPVRQQAEGLSECPECYGTGKLITIERHLSRYWSEAPPGRESQAMTQAIPGLLMVGYESFTFKPVARPHEEDLIFKVEWHPAGNVHNLLGAYEIKKVIDLRQEQGVLVFYKVYASNAAINAGAVEALLRQETRIRVVD